MFPFSPQVLAIICVCVRCIVSKITKNQKKLHHLLFFNKLNLRKYSNSFFKISRVRWPENRNFRCQLNFVFQKKKNNPIEYSTASEAQKLFLMFLVSFSLMIYPNVYRYDYFEELVFGIHVGMTQQNKWLLTESKKKEKRLRWRNRRVNDRKKRKKEKYSQFTAQKETTFFSRLDICWPNDNYGKSI